MLGPELLRGCRQLVAILVAAAALAAMPATANAFGPAVTLTTDPVAPVFGQNGWFNDMDLAQNSGRVRVNVSATDSATSTVILLSCTGGTVAGETGSDPRTAHIDLTADGEHVVSCTADNADGRTGPAATTTVKIDRTRPDLDVPGDITTTPTGIFGAHVTWTTTPADASCTPPSGSAFAAGTTTTVTCTATDQAGNTTTKTFTVRVKSGAELLDELFASYSTGWAGYLVASARHVYGLYPPMVCPALQQARALAPLLPIFDRFTAQQTAQFIDALKSIQGALGCGGAAAAQPNRTPTVSVASKARAQKIVSRTKAKVKQAKKHVKAKKRAKAKRRR